VPPFEDIDPTTSQHEDEHSKTAIRQTKQVVGHDALDENIATNDDIFGFERGSWRTPLKASKPKPKRQKKGQGGIMDIISSMKAKRVMRDEGRRAHKGSGTAVEEKKKRRGGPNTQSDFADVPNSRRLLRKVISCPATIFAPDADHLVNLFEGLSSVFSPPPAEEVDGLFPHADSEATLPDVHPSEDPVDASWASHVNFLSCLVSHAALSENS
jgi:hypothetical protein